MVATEQSAKGTLEERFGGLNSGREEDVTGYAGDKIGWIFTARIDAVGDLSVQVFRADHSRVDLIGLYNNAVT